MTSQEASSKKRKLKRPVVSDVDGTREGGLAFCVACLGGMVVAAVLAPGALASFWVWCGILAMAVAIGRGAQMLFARATNEVEGDAAHAPSEG